MFGQLFSLLISLPAQTVVDSGPAVTVRESICRHRPAAFRGASFRLLPIPTDGRQNETGVLLIVNCSDRAIVSVRDPNRSLRHLREQVYDPGLAVRIPDDPHRYAALNFNKDDVQTPFDHTTYMRGYNWSGPCRYRSLELTTADPDDPSQRQTVTFDLDVCQNVALALLPSTPR